ncbi:hypothetical protein BC831DRAFT_467076 [Entophlyctis helioformis]|nr:hypothetical protein BC831DRAFT_467076 [Entophlyctis helioformis]
MYSRSERKFLVPDKDHANPSLGPGCYTSDDPVLVAGKLIGNDGYAPFASLTPRVSYFDELVGIGPAPGAYDGQLGIGVTHRKDPVTLFGRSRTERFNKIGTATPGPGTYRIPSSIVVKGGAATQHHKPPHGTISHFSLTQQPIGIDHGIIPANPQKSSSHSQQPQLPPKDTSMVASGGDPSLSPLVGMTGAGDSGSGGAAGVSLPLQPGASPPVAIVSMGTPLAPTATNGGVGSGGAIAASHTDPPYPDTALLAQQPLAQAPHEQAIMQTGLVESGAILDLEPHGPEAKRLSLVSRKVGSPSSPGGRGPAASKRTHRAGAGNRKSQGAGSGADVESAGQHVYKIMWKRKYIPPSIPVGRYAFGYQENVEGDLVPRKPPKKTVEDQPAYLTSFVEQAKHEARGYRFAKGGERLSYKVNESPGPTKYNPLAGDKYLMTRTTVPGPAVMTLAPCKRITDEIVADSVKKGIPGPGAYDLKAPLAEKIAQPRNRIKFGGSSNERAYLNPELMKTPGPGAYYPEFADHPKPHSHKPQPFGSTTKRFDMTQTLKLESGPVVGTYDIDEMDSIFRRVQNRANYMSLRPAAFGSVADRFPQAKRSVIPGPGAYDVKQAKDEPTPANEIKMSLKGQAEKRKEYNKLQKLLSRGPTQLLLGNIHLPAAQVHVPIFGTQTERFSDANTELPPPGAYDIAQSFQVMRTKGRIENTGVLASQSKRELFTLKGNVPGPGEYEPVLDDRKEIRQKIGAFLTTAPRFLEKYERVPGPGAYLPPDYENGLVRKTYNITLTEWGQQQ